VSTEIVTNGIAFPCASNTEPFIVSAEQWAARANVSNIHKPNLIALFAFIILHVLKSGAKVLLFVHFGYEKTDIRIYLGKKDGEIIA
jgi:hypothetical protein